MGKIFLAAVGDIHSPKYLDLFLRALDSLSEDPDLFLLLGDIVYKGRWREFRRVVLEIKKRIDCTIVSCFGNEEFEDVIPRIMEENSGDVIFLDDEAVKLDLGGLKIGIVGTRGSLDKPTSWQARNVPNIERIYAERVEKVEKLLQGLKTRYRILAMHYAPTYKTLRGEPPRIYPMLGSRRFESIIVRIKPDLVLHAHSHNGSRYAEIEGVPIYNASLPLSKEILVLEFPRRISAERTLLDFLGGIDEEGV